MGIGIEFMHNVAGEIIHITPDDDKTINDLWQEFYSIMRKYGIKQGTRSLDGVGIITSNYEWTMCVSLFIENTISYINFNSLLNEVPKDLECY